MCGVCALTVRHRCASSCQDTLDPSKNDDVILALIIAAASSKHRNSKRMQSLQQRALVSLVGDFMLPNWSPLQSVSLTDYSCMSRLSLLLLSSNGGWI